MSNEDYRLKCKTQAVYEFSILTENLKDIMDDANWEFIQHPDFVPISSNDSSDDNNDSDDDKKKKKKKKNNDSDDEKSKKKKKNKRKNNDDSDDNDSDDEKSKKKKKKKNSNDSDDDKKKKKKKKNSSESDNDSDDDKKKKKKKKRDSDSEDDDKKNEENMDEKFSGIKIHATDKDTNIMIYIKIYAKSFSHFHVKGGKQIVGLDMMMVHKYFRRHKEGLLSLCIKEEDQRNITFKIKTEEKNNIDKYMLQIMDLDNKDYVIPDIEFTLVVTMKCAEFHKVCRDLSQIADFVEIVCTSKSLFFRCKSKEHGITNINQYNNTNDKNKKNGVKIVSHSSDPDEIFRATFSLKYIIMFTKCSKLCEIVQLYFKNNTPLFLKYEVASIGNMIVGINTANDKSIQQQEDVKKTKKKSAASKKDDDSDISEKSESENDQDSEIYSSKQTRFKA